MKRKLKLVIDYIGGILAVMGLVSLIAYSLNPAEWGWLGRFTVGMVVGALTVRLIDNPVWKR